MKIHCYIINTKNGTGDEKYMIKIGICDDHFQNMKVIKDFLQNLYQEKEGFLFYLYTPNEIRIDMEDKVFDCEILIMNTDYPECGQNGILLARQVNEYFPFCKIIYLTENEDAIRDVYETKHCYFVRWKDVKQILPLAMRKAVNMVKLDAPSKKLEVICDGHHVFFDRTDIIYIEKYGRIIKIVTKDHVYSCYETLAGIYKRLGAHMIRVHGGYVVNLAYITYLGVDCLEVRNGKVIPIGRTYDKEVRKAYQEYWKK